MITETGTDVSKAAALLRSGEVVAIPTETVYGLAANAFHEGAVLNVFRVKERPSFDPLIVHVAGREKVHLVAKDIPDVAFQLMERFWPGPLTVLLKKLPVVPDLVTSGLDTVGVRMPHHQLTLELLNSIDFPLAAPSANPFGYISPTTARHVKDQLDGMIPYILDGGPCNVGVESTIIGFDEDRCIVYRYGGIPVAEILKITGNLSELVDVQQHQPAYAPGMLLSHYAPRKPFYLGNAEKILSERESEFPAGLITYTRPLYDVPSGTVMEILSEGGNPDEAARNLFSALRRLDASEVRIIIAEPVPDSGIGMAINDRLKRAAAAK